MKKRPPSKTMQSMIGFFRSDIKLGIKVMIASFAFGFIGTLPLILYVLLGPKNGNPIGLGLLAFICVLLGGIGVIAGAVGLALNWLAQREL